MAHPRHIQFRSLRTTLVWLLWLLPFCCAEPTAALKAGETGADAGQLRSAFAGRTQQVEPPAETADTMIRFGPGSTWSARTRTGRMLGGTWSCMIDPATGTASGTWTLRDSGNRILLRGTWSAAKAAEEWRGAWRALVAGQTGERSGTWASNVNLPPDTPLAGMFEQAVRQLVNGTWQSAGQSGGWSIRAVR